METEIPKNIELYSCDTITLNDDTEPEIYVYFLNRPRKLKYDNYKGKWYRIVWSIKAVKDRLERQKETKRTQYKQSDPLNEKNELTWYLKNKMGIPQNPIGRPKK
jgi:hypothetical protein